MVCIYTIFDSNSDSRPLYSLIINDDGEDEYIPLYIKGSGKSIYDIENDVGYIKKIVESSDKVFLNDYKQHLIAFGIDHRKGRIYDNDNIISVSPSKISRLASVRPKPKLWQRICAEAAVVYRNLQNRGVIYKGRKVKPIWGKTFSGRSKCTGFNVQGVGDDDIYNPNGDNLFINFDWIAADLRVAAFLSGDDNLSQSFTHSDPYSYLAEHINDGVSSEDILSRDDSKVYLLQSMYSLDVADDNVAFNLYSSLKSWILECINNLADHGCLHTILGRRFAVTTGRSKKSVFNAIVQGSVAHAMQLCLARAYARFGDSVFTENHDSLVMTCRGKSDVHRIVDSIVPVMTRPFKGIINDDPTFPVIVNIGKKYKRWKRYKRFDDG